MQTFTRFYDQSDFNEISEITRNQMISKSRTRYLKCRIPRSLTSFQTDFNSVNREIQVCIQRALLIDSFEYCMYKSMLVVYGILLMW